MQEANTSDLKIAIVGLGLMGGSMAKALNVLGYEISGVDENRESLEWALSEGVINQGASDLITGVKDANVIILATPVRTIIENLHILSIHRPEGCFVMDLGSTKVEIGETMSGLPASFEAIGAHPICGREQSGYGASTSSLYEGQTFILSRNRRTTKRAELIATEIIKAVGARFQFLEASLHDDIVALTSHLPYLIASLLTSQVAGEAAHDSRYWQISATGLRDVTRLASSDPNMMFDIISSNRKSILIQLIEIEQRLNKLIRYLERDKLAEIEAWLRVARQQHGSYLESRWSEPGLASTEELDERNDDLSVDHGFG